MNLWSKISGVFSGGKKKKPVVNKAWPNWIPLSGGGGNYGTDFYGRQSPSPNELLNQFNDMVYATVSLVANNVATIPLKLYVMTDQGQAKPKCRTRAVSRKALQEITSRKAIARGILVEEVVDHPALDLLNKANSYHCWGELARLTQTDLEVIGDSYWLIKPDNFGLPCEIYSLDPKNMQPVRDGQGFIRGWKYGQGEATTDYSLNEIIHFKFPNPHDRFGLGFSPLRAAYNRVLIGWKELGYLDATLQNMGRPDAVLSPDEPISAFEAERLAKDYLQRFRGQGNGGIMILDGPMKLTPIGWQPQDLAELRVYQTIKTTISNIWHVPPDIWELGESNRATAETAMYSLAVHCIKPRMQQLLEKLNERLLPLFDGGQGRLFFEATEIVPEDRQFLLTERQALLNTGVITRDEARTLYGFDSQEWAKEPMLPGGGQQLLAVAEQQAELLIAQQQAAIEPVPEAAPTEPAQDRSQQAPALAQLQEAVYAGQLPRQAAIANVQFTFGFSQDQAEALFPDVQPVKVTPEETPQEGQEAKDGPSSQSWPVAPTEVKGLPAKTPVLDVPDVRQEESYDCGAAATASVCGFFGVGPDNLEDYRAALGTTPERGTDPGDIFSYLEQVSLTPEAKDGMTVDDLMKNVLAGKPVICCIQDYEDRPQDIPEEQAGHYVVVCGADDDSITLQDPSAGRVEMPTIDFLARWEDTNENGDYVHYGITVGPATNPEGKATKKTVRTPRMKSPAPMAEALKGYFAKQRDAVLGKLKAFQGADTKALPMNGWFDIEDWTKQMAEVMRPVVALYWDHGAKDTVARIGASMDLLKVVQPNLKAGVDRATFLFCRETNETTSLEIGEAVKQLRGSLTEGLNAGEVQNQLTKRVSDIFENAEAARSFRIAVTEASRAQHAAQELTARESGLVKGKRWILSDNACDLCKQMEGKVVPLDGTFTKIEGSGPYSDVKYPPLHPHCMCDMIEVIEGVND